MKTKKAVLFGLMMVLAASTVWANAQELPKTDVGETAQDKKVADDIRKAYDREYFVSVYARNAFIYVANGSVILHGTIPSQKSKDDFTKLTQITAGKSYRVDNRLEIKPLDLESVKGEDYGLSGSWPSSRRK